ncbi:MAG: NTP transferase domain-containing protein, partial [Candidatus Omnitrophota bacterium]
MKNIATIILAAGEGTRMKSSLPKVLHSICGKPMAQYLIDNVNSIGMEKIWIIIGHRADLVKERLGPGIKCIIQDELLGTGDAVSRARSAIIKDNKIENILILYGDTPLLSQDIIQKL